jgi:hypothetical protein
VEVGREQQRRFVRRHSDDEMVAGRLGGAIFNDSGNVNTLQHFLQ